LVTDAVNPAACHPASRCASRGLRTVLALFFLYAAAQAVLRVAVSDSLELDEAEQVLLAQQWAWGYGGQPPLYTWLQAAFFTVCGVNVAALALLKALLVFAVLAVTYLAAREASGSDATAFAAAVAWFLLPHFAWEARRDLSHTVLALACVAATVFFVVRWLKRPTMAAGLGLGLSTALGVLSKYNFLLFLAALTLGGLSLASVRASLRTWRVVPGMVVFWGITGAHAAWFFANRELATAGHEKLFADGAPGRVHAALTGLWSLLEQGVPAVLLLAAVCAMCAWRKRVADAPPDAARALERLLARTLVFGVALCGVLAIGFQVRFKARWLLPLLAVGPLYGAMWLASRAGEARVRWLARIGAAAALVALVALPAAAPLASLTGKFTRLNAPYAALAAQLRASGVAPKVIVAENRLVGGNLKLFFPESCVVAPERVAPPDLPSGERCVVWEATRRAEMPPALAAFAASLCENDPAAASPRYVEATQKYSRTRTMRLGFVLMPPRSSASRP
jgi:4-amino-4-deoxy-L-arabinose transferase-like glycosyltransferase